MDALDELLPLGAGLVDLGTDLGLRKEGDDGDTGVSTDDSDDGVCWVGRLDSREEAGGTDDIEGGDTVKLGWVVLAGLLEDFSNNRDRRVDRV